MNNLTSFAVLFATALLVSLSVSAGSDETTSSWSDKVIRYGPDTEAEQTPAPKGDTNVPSQYVPPTPGGYAQPWQQPPHWRAPQQLYGQFPPHYPRVGQYQAYPAAPATTRENPLSAELQQTQEQLATKSGELDEAHEMHEQLHGKLQTSLAAEAGLSDKLAYSTREQHALRVRVSELTKTLNTSNATLEQQHQLINNHQAHNQKLTVERDQLRSELASRDKQMATLQAELQAGTQALAQARSIASSVSEALSAAKVQIGAHKDELIKLEAELEHQEAQLQSELQAPTE